MNARGYTLNYTTLTDAAEVFAVCRESWRLGVADFSFFLINGKQRFGRRLAY
jgi:hypothetical protein